jgi:hypothetical protein
MKEESTAHGANPEQLHRLFNIGRDTNRHNEKMSSNQRKTEMLCRFLAQTLPLDKSQINMLPSVLGQLCHSIGLLAGETITELISNPSTAISSIERIKCYSKELSARAKSKAEHEVATAIYYVAIAHALVYHDKRITRFSYEKLEASFTRLVKEKWIPKNLSMLFKIARKCCKEKVKS